MPRIVVIIASNQNVIERTKTLESALKSIQKNIRHPDHVYVSYSGEYAEEKKWADVLISVPHNFFYHPQRKLQFEHYQYLTQYIKDDDILCFLDDDDLYDPKKIKLTYDYFCEHKDVDVISHNYLLFMSKEKLIEDTEDIDKSTKVCILNEHWTLTVVGAKFKDWFINCKEYANQSFDDILKTCPGHADLLFSASLKKYIRKFSELPLIYHRIDNMIKRDYG